MLFHKGKAATLEDERQLFRRQLEVAKRTNPAQRSLKVRHQFFVSQK